MKICTRCNTKKPLTDFYSQSDRKKGSSLCKSCFNEYCQTRWINRKKEAIEYLGNKCYDCNQSFPYPAMQFHHINPEEKSFVWSKLRLKSWDKVTQELDKCQLLCANCHAVRHSLVYN